MNLQETQLSHLGKVSDLYDIFNFISYKRYFIHLFLTVYTLLLYLKLIKQWSCIRFLLLSCDVVLFMCPKQNLVKSLLIQI